jgi:hypothetical protein
MSIPRVLRITGVVVVLLLLAGALGVVAWGAWTVDRKVAEAQAHMVSRMDAFHARVEADAREVGPDGPLGPVGRSANAGTFLNPRVTWRGWPAAVSAYRATVPADVTPITIPPDVVMRLRGKGWEEAVEGTLAQDVDVGWLQGLSRFDHWDLDAESPVSAMPWPDPVRAPVPDYGLLLAAARVRVLQGLRNGTPSRAATELRHLARLLDSTETLVGTTMAVQVLRVESRAHALAASRGIPADPSWRPLDPKELDRLQRLAQAAMAYASLLAPPTHWSALDTLPVGRCAALSEGLWFALVFEPLLGDRLRDRYQALERSLEASQGRCRLTLLRRAWRLSRAEKAELFRRNICGAGPDQEQTAQDPGGCPSAWVSTHVPWIKEKVGMVLAAVAMPDPFGPYQAMSAPAEPPEPAGGDGPGR